MLRKIRAGLRLIAGKRPPGPDLPVFPDDVFLIAYPKSGNTWTRFQVGNLLYPDRKVDFLTIPDLVPHFDIKPSKFFRGMSRPRIINCHEPFRPQFKRVIYVVRDPRDVVVSLYHFQRKRSVVEDNYPLDRFVSRFVTGEQVRPPRLGSWAENVGSWLAMRANDPNLLFLRYEDMLQAPEASLAKIAAFMKIDATPAQIAKAVERSSSQNMRSLEKVQGAQWHQSEGTRQDIPFVRSAKSGGWKAVLTPPMLAEMTNAWGPLMDRLGYTAEAASVSSVPSMSST